MTNSTDTLFSNSIVTMVADFVGNFMVGLYFIVGFIVVGWLAFSTVNKMHYITDVVEQQHHIVSTNHNYVISTIDCTALVAVGTNKILKTKAGFSDTLDCSHMTQNDVNSYIKYHTENSMWSSSQGNRFVYYVFFAFTMLILYIVMPMNLKLLHPIFTAFCLSGMWLIASLVVYPMTYGDSSATTQANIERTNVYVTSVISSSDNARYLRSPITFWGMVGATSLTEVPKSF